MVGKTHCDHGRPAACALAMSVWAISRSMALRTPKPVHALDLHDNTFIIATADRVFRINSFDLTPAGAVPDLWLIDIKAETETIARVPP